MRRFAFTLTELLISMLIIAIMGGAFTLSTDIGKQKAKDEAEKLAAEISGMFHKAQTMHVPFWVHVKSGGLEIYSGRIFNKKVSQPGFSASKGCTYDKPSATKVGFSYDTDPEAGYMLVKSDRVQVIAAGNVDDGPGRYNITVSGAGKSPYYVVVSADDVEE